MRRFIVFTITVLATLAAAVLLNNSPAQAQPSFDQDCLPYDPANLRIVDEGATGWLLTDGSSRLKIFDTRADAEQGLQVAQAHTQHCFIGRDNTRSDRARYIFEYWQGTSDLEVTIPRDDCIAYDRDNLSINNLGADGWQVVSGRSALLLLDNQTDAQNTREILSNHDELCFIGRDNTRADRHDYIMTYLFAEPLAIDPAIDPSIDPSGPDFDPIPVTVPPAGSGVSPASEDCLPYNPASLRIEDSGATGWTLTDGTSNLVLLDTRADARIARDVAVNHTQQCFIGRGNSRPNRYRYIFQYWKGDSGRGPVLPENDCIGYDPTALTLNDLGADGWQIVSGRSALLVLDTQADALLAQDVLSGADQLCYIGRDNTRSNRYRYISTYLRQSTATVPPTVAPPPTAAPTAAPTTAPPATDCSTAPARRMVVGQQGRVTFTTGTPVRLRNGPGVSFAILDLIPEGEVFSVTGGPQCADGFWWWSVRTGDAISGWMAEGRPGNYFIEPYSP